MSPVVKGQSYKKKSQFSREIIEYEHDFHRVVRGSEPKKLD